MRTPKGLYRRRCLQCWAWYRTNNRHALRCDLCVYGIEPVRALPAGCLPCARGAGMCDDHVPPVCVCTQPHPDGIGQCRVCLRPYKPQVPGFDACRAAWIAHLAVEPAGV